jgi:D-alanyl-D-alanine carboxypeptidase (penicillin-binding protein 5/6)
MHPDLLPAPAARPLASHARRRRWWAWFGCVVLLTAVAVVWLERPHRPGDLTHLPWPSTGEAALVVDGHRVTGPAADTVVPIASVAKVMTAYVVLHDHPLAGGDAGPSITITPDEAAAYPSQLAKGESLVRVRAGESLTERQALEALLLPSADNVAWILARWDAGDQAQFVAQMNAAARQLGMTHTAYSDPSGLDSSTVSTVDDQLTLAVAAMKLPALAAVVAEPSARLPVAGEVHNYNTLLGSDGVVGLKTGSTSAAGGCLVFVARRGGHTIYGAVFGQPGQGLAMLTAALAASRQLVIAA